MGSLQDRRDVGIGEFQGTCCKDYMSRAFAVKAGIKVLAHDSLWFFPALHVAASIPRATWEAPF